MTFIHLLLFLYNILSYPPDHIPLATKNKVPQIQAKAGITKSVFGTFPDGRVAHLFTLRNQAGMEVNISNYGGYIVSWTAPDRKGKQENITLGVPTFADYLKGTPAFGPIIGRFGNRIANGKFSLDGKEYSLHVGRSGHHLHGGKEGFDKKLWSATPVNSNEPALELQYTSPDGEEGYPGTLSVKVVYTLQKDNALRIDYTATTDAPTILNLTNHAYFNLSGMKQDILKHELMIQADQFLVTDQNQIPTGERRKVAGTALDFTKSTTIGTRINDTTDTQIRYGFGYDHCFVFSDTSNRLKSGATLYEPVSGRFLEMYTTEPAVQLYTGNHLNGAVKGKEGIAFTRRFGVCLETQHFPDAPNHPDFPSTTLRPGETYRSTTVYKFSIR
ncbi:galactose mutarotase [Rhodocytophaga rosea]|uniref:Aldose 1-epimerase n=1 Tax=Rhodocytophaga rosea TaxID=2704465 RepID=A0A6C0GIW3_9BACT|nr:aldose epimerase family protein [Rhodocytophaga rosea]QHT67650.1 galactose mutarotase [Rhodocytophaga rosea]